MLGQECERNDAKNASDKIPLCGPDLGICHAIVATITQTCLQKTSERHHWTVLPNTIRERKEGKKKKEKMHKRKTVQMVSR